ncbi:MAG: hypothetical protein IT181_16135 [Acidobacteria bacterium]|nr:hypothetical protein [Acidobacteriota bacterium]
MNLTDLSKTARRLAPTAARWGFAAAVLLAAPDAARAQSAIIYGSLSNFDISNDTGLVCHGFEIDMDGVQPSDVLGTFTATRYGAAEVLPTATGAKVRWKSAYDAATGQWQTRTIQHTVPWFSGQCYSWVPGTYENGGCEHFGTWTPANTTKVTSRWLCEDSNAPGTLTPIDPPTAVPYANYYVNPPAAANNPPQLVAEIEAPEPAEAPDQYGDAQWIRSYVMQLPRALTLEELMADNPDAVPMNLNQLEADYQVIQDEPVSGGNGNRRRKRNSGNIEPTTRSVVRRIETWSFTGSYDPITHEAICLDLLCNAPDATEIGALLAVQMTAANVQPDSVVISRVGGGRVSSSDRVIDCGSKCGGSYDAGTVVTLTAKADSKSTFTGWNGACAGTGTCTVTANGIVNVGAVFSAPPAGGGGGGGGTTGGGTTGKTLTVKTAGGKGLVTSAPAGISCGKTCSKSFTTGTAVTLTAAPEPGFVFVNWTGACTGAQATCTITMNANQATQANFVKP